MGRRGLAAAAAALLTLTLAACGGGDDKFDAKELKDGAAAGTGYTFTLPDGFKQLDLTDEGDRELVGDIKDAVQGFDPKGFLFDGFFARTSDAKAKPVVSVAVEAATEDSELVTVGKSSLQLIGASTGESPTQTGEPETLGTESAFSARYFKDANELRLVTAKHGPYVYSLTVQMTDGHTKALDALTSSIARSWRWTTPNATAAKELAKLRGFTGKGYSVTLPLGWRGTGEAALKETGVAGLEALWRGYISPGYSTNVTVGQIAYKADPGKLADTVIADERKSAKKGGRITLQSIRKDGKVDVGGEQADAIDIRSKLSNGIALRQREVVVLRNGTLYRITLSTLVDRYTKDLPQFEETLKTWKWR